MVFVCCFRGPVDIEQRHQELVKIVGALKLTVDEQTERMGALEKKLVGVESKLPSPWVSTAASAATAMGMTVLSNGQATSAAADLPRLIMGAFARK